MPNNELDYNEDPELVDDDEEGVGDDDQYDGEAAEFIEYDPTFFALPDDFEFDEGDEE